MAAPQDGDVDARRSRYAAGRFEDHGSDSGLDELDELPPAGAPSTAAIPLRSQYTLTRQEIAQNIANRFVHSRAYIFLYLLMAALSITTVVLSLSASAGACPSVAFYVLEVIVNTAMIAEVCTRFVAFGRRFWQSPFNTIDLALTMFCALTLLVLAVSGCGSTTSKEEELLDTLLLVARNVLQFGRLATVMRKSGRSIFARPKPIDLSRAQQRGYSLDIDMPDEELFDAGDVEEGRPLVAR